MVSENIGNLEKVLEEIKSKTKQTIIPITGAPDPDAISSALAMKAILESRKIKSSIIYVHETGYDENRALIKLLNVDLLRYDLDKPNLDFSKIGSYCLVDAQDLDKELITPLKDIPLIAVVDHHERKEGLEAKFVDIRPEVGAAATIFTEYLESFGILNDENESLATALMYGIISDTKGIRKAGYLDWSALAKLQKHADIDILRKILVPSITKSMMCAMNKAYRDNKVEVANNILSSVGKVREQDAGAISRSADGLIAIRGIDLVVVYGIVGENVMGSVRTQSDSIKPGDFIRTTFLKDDLIGGGGGKEDDGGFKFKLGPLLAKLPVDDEDLVDQVVERYMKSKFFDAVGKPEEKVEVKE